MSLRKSRVVSIVIGAALVPAFLLLFTLDPSILAAVSGWYGYNGTPVAPEPTSLMRPFHGVSERNNSVLVGNGDIVQYLNGVIKYEADGISVPSPGFSYSHRPTYSNNFEGGTVTSNDGNAKLPQGWNWHTGLFQLVDMGSGELRSFGKVTASTKYTGASGTYNGQLGADSVVVHNTTPKEMVLRATNGAQVTFYDFDSSHADKFGACKKIVDAAGNTLTATYYTAAENSNLKDLLKVVTDSGGHTYTYTYIDSSGATNNRRIQKVEVADGSTVLGKSDEHVYYDSLQYSLFASGSGSNGDLMRFKVTERNSVGLNEDRYTLCRYYTGTWSTNNKGADHKVRYIVGPQSYAELDAAVADPLLASDNDVAAYADYFFEYDSNGFVTKATVRGAGCSCGSAQGTFTYAYTTNGSWTPSSGFDVWKVSVTQTNPDGTVRIVDINKGGSIINDVLQTDATYTSGVDQRWITHYEFDTSGRITEVYRPSACSDYSSHAATLRSGDGLVDVYVYGSSGTLTERKIKKGSSGTPYFLEQLAYGPKTLGSHTIYLPTSKKVYPTETTIDETTFSRTFHPDTYDLDGDSNTTEDSLNVKDLTLTHPVVPYSSPDENGSGVADTHKYYFSALGQLQWEKDEEGSITYRAYHTSSGADLGTLVTQIVDLDTDGFSPTPPTGYTDSSGLSLQTDYEYEATGRLSAMTDPADRIEKYFYTNLSERTDFAGRETVVAKYPHVDTNGTFGPASISVFNLDGKLITQAKGVATDGDSVLSDDFTSAQTLEGAFIGTLFERMEYVWPDGQKLEERAWTNAENPNEDKYIKKFGYDSMGRLARVKDAEGTITRTYYTLQGRVKERKIGMNDYVLGDDLGEPSGTNNMTTVEKRFYDGEETASTNVGDGNLTKMERYEDASVTRDTLFTYDWRGRQLTADGEETFLEKRDYDNLGRVTFSYRYEATESSGNLRSKTETKYDSRGRVYQSIVYEVNPSSGAIDDSLTTNFWYSERGNLLKTREPSGLFRKNLYDGARRLEKTYVSYDTDETIWTAADDVTGDIVVEQTEYDRDAVGNVILETRFERKTTTTTTGGLSSTTGVRYYLASWYDLIHRLDAVANYGTNGGSTLTRPGTPPASSDTVLVTSFTYNDAGHIEDTTSPKDKVSRKEYDDLGRVITIIVNYVDGTVGSGDDDRKQEFLYNKVSKVTHRKTWMTSGSDVEDTEYVYGVTKNTSAGDSKIESKNLLKTIKYPDPSTGSPSTSGDDQESFAYNAQGEVIWRKDQNGNIHEFDFDDLGRRTIDKVSTFGDGVIDFAKRIQTSYDALDRVTSVESYNVATGGTVLNVLNEVEYVYNGFGQVKESKQEHNGAAGASTLKVAYSYSEAEAGDPTSRLQSIQYPATNRTIYLHYDDPNGSTDYDQLDWILGRPSAVSNNSSISADRVADYVYEGSYRVRSRDSQEPTTDIAIDYAYDRFGRVEDLTAQSSSAINDFTYTYNRQSQATSRADAAATAKDELYTYDDLDRLDVFKRGVLDSGVITSPVRSQDWGLDLVGNWDTIATDGATAINRNHNRSNEITDVDEGQTGGDPTYDKNGNTTKIDRPAPQSRDFEYDAWNRLATVKSGGTPVAVYVYDGLGRRIQDTSADRDFYYSEGWQLLSERDGSTSTDKTLREYVWGLQYIDEILERSEDKNSDGDTRDTGDESLFYIQDANWNVQTLCSESGSPVERVLHDSYGLPSFYDASWGTRSSSAYGNTVLFTGRHWNATSFTYEFRHREQSPYLGRFLQTDPVGTAILFSSRPAHMTSAHMTGSWGDHSNAGNAYGYTGNDPTNASDAIGTKTCTIEAALFSEVLESTEYVNDPQGGVERLVSAVRSQDPIRIVTTIASLYTVRHTCKCKKKCPCFQWEKDSDPPFPCAGTGDVIPEVTAEFPVSSSAECTQAECEQVVGAPEEYSCCGGGGGGIERDVTIEGWVIAGLGLFGAADACRRNLSFQGHDRPYQETGIGRCFRVGWGDKNVIRLDHAAMEQAGRRWWHLNLGPKERHLPVWPGQGFAPGG
jgi:YD repeat-containing protein